MDFILRIVLGDMALRCTLKLLAEQELRAPSKLSLQLDSLVPLVIFGGILGPPSSARLMRIEEVFHFADSAWQYVPSVQIETFSGAGAPRSQ